MGHYASEMGYPPQEDIDRKEKRRLDAVKAIELDIKKRGIAAVLADIVLDPTVYSIRSL